MKNSWYRIAAVPVIAIGIAGACFAAVGAPEIDPSSGGSAIALLAGALLLVRARKRS